MRRIVDTKEKRKKNTSESVAKPQLYCPTCGKERNVSEARTLLSLEKTYNEKHVDPYSGHPAEGWAIQAAIERKLIWACDKCLSTGRAIRANPWLQVSSLAMPQFAYVDKPLKCEDCGVEFTFSATEQQYWYEKLGFIRDSFPKQCAPCRHKRRVYKRHFHDLQRAILALDPNSATQLAEIAELYLRVGSQERALEFLRRAKNKAKKQSDKDQFQQRISSIQAELEAGSHRPANP